MRFSKNKHQIIIPRLFITDFSFIGLSCILYVTSLNPSTVYSILPTNYRLDYRKSNEPNLRSTIQAEPPALTAVPPNSGGHRHNTIPLIINYKWNITQKFKVDEKLMLTFILPFSLVVIVLKSWYTYFLAQQGQSKPSGFC